MPRLHLSFTCLQSDYFLLSQKLNVSRLKTQTGILSACAICTMQADSLKSHPWVYLRTTTASSNVIWQSCRNIKQKASSLKTDSAYWNAESVYRDYIKMDHRSQLSPTLQKRSQNTPNTNIAIETRAMEAVDQSWVSLSCQSWCLTQLLQQNLSVWTFKRCKYHFSGSWWTSGLI